MSKLPMAPEAGEDSAGDGRTGRRTPGRAVQHAVLAAQGRPPALYEVAVRPLWENHFRVNVLVGPDPTSIRIAHSFFVEAGETGDIRSSEPGITRVYA